MTSVVVISVVVESSRCSSKTLQKRSCPYAPLDAALRYVTGQYGTDCTTWVIYPSFHHILIAAAESSEEAVTSSQDKVNELLQSIMDIEQLNISDLPDLQTRLQQARAEFSEEDYAAIITNLQQSVDEQDGWLLETQATVAELQAQIDGLESFKVNQ